MAGATRESGHSLAAPDWARFIALLAELVAIPTVSSEPSRAQDLQRGAAWIARRLEEQVGCTARVSGRCVVARCGWDDEKPLVALHSRYDVAFGQGWSSDPWRLTTAGGHLYGRGVAESKGPLLAQIFAVRRLMRHRPLLCRHDEDAECASEKGSSFAGGCPVNVLFLVGGGEGPGDIEGMRRAICEARADGWLRGEVAGALVNGASCIDEEQPCICYSSSGAVDVEVCIQGDGSDLLAEPMLDLMCVCATLCDARGAPCVRGLDGGVRPPSGDDTRFASAAPAEQPAEALRRTWSRPSLSITQVGQGLVHDLGRGAAQQASCIVSLRTAPSQSGDEVAGALHRHLRHEFETRGPSNRLETRTRVASGPWQAKTSSRAYLAAKAAVAQAWGLEVLEVREGRAVPVLPVLEAELGCDAVLMPLGQARLPDERVTAKALAHGIDAIVGALLGLADAPAE